MQGRQAMPEIDERFDPEDTPGDAVDDMESLLWSHRPGLPPARPDFRADLEARFLRSVEAQVALARSRPGLALRLASWPVPIAGAVLSLVLLLVGAWWVVGAPRVPAAMPRAELVARNAEAWAEAETIVGSFSTGDGWYFEEWLRPAPAGLMYKRFSRPPATTVLGPQWNVSDGRTEWVVDAGSGAVRAERPAGRAIGPHAPPQERMQCAALALPPGLALGPQPVPALLGGVPVYRLSGRTADGLPAVYWLDADDFLVRRIDRPNGAIVWERTRLELGEDLAVDLFRPDALANL